MRRPRLALLLLLALAPRATLAQAPRPYAFGARTCTGCHDNPAKQTDSCRMIEHSIWAARDPHRLALDWGRPDHPETWTTAAARRAWSIGRRLGLADVTRDSACTGCHSLDLAPDTPRQSFVPTVEGVTCVACHGPYRDWVLEHQATEDPQWRASTRQQKAARTGMVDLWDPQVRASVCLSCHLGDPDPARHKRITHDMYAAGHPPLSGIEVAAFCVEEPRHWQPLACKPPEIQRRLGHDPVRLEQAQLVAVGSLAVFRQALSLLAADARDPATWPELARLDCASCHHALQAPSTAAAPWRQQRKPSRPPGRPLDPLWTRALVPLGLEAADSAASPRRAAELESLVRNLEQALAHQPLGDAPRTAQAASALADWLQSPLDELATRSVDSRASLRMLHRLGREAALAVPDHATARQLAWAFRSTYTELLATAPSPALQAAAPEIDSLMAALDHDLDLILRPPADPARNTCAGLTLPAALSGPAARPLLDAFLPARLDRAARFDPALFQARFARLVALLPP